MTVLVHDTARRFITFIDEMYDAGIRLVWTSNVEPINLFKILNPIEVEVTFKYCFRFGCIIHQDFCIS
jgi:predicted ATPase